MPRAADAAQDAQAGALHRGELVVDQHVLAVAEEGEVVVGQPLEQLDRVGDVLVRHRQLGVRAAGGGQLVGDHQRPLAHPRPVLDRVPHVGQHPPHLVVQLLTGLGVAHRIDLDPDPALHDVAVDRVVRLDVRLDLVQRAERLPAHHDQRVHQQVHLELVRGEQAVTESTRNGMSSVTIEHDAVRLVLVRRADVELELAGQPGGGELAVRQRGRVHLLGGEADQLLVRREPPEPAHQRGRGVILAGQRHRLRHQTLGVGQRLVQLAVLGGAEPARSVRARDLARSQVQGRIRSLPHRPQACLALPSTHHSVG